MQSFDQSLMHWYSQGVISYESALFYATNPSEFALRVQGVAGSSDTSWDGFREAVVEHRGCSRARDAEALDELVAP